MMNPPYVSVTTAEPSMDGCSHGIHDKGKRTSTLTPSKRLGHGDEFDGDVPRRNFRCCGTLDAWSRPIQLLKLSWWDAVYNFSSFSRAGDFFPSR